MQWTKKLMMVALVAAAAFAGGAFMQWVSSPAVADEAAKQVPAVVEAKTLHILGGEGDVRVALGMGKGGPGIAVFDGDGAARVAMGIGPDGPGLAILDTEGAARIALGLGEDGPALIFLGPDGNPLDQ